MSPTRKTVKEKAVIPLAERFWLKVEKTDTCWLWTGAPDGHGYGVMSVREFDSPQGAHRVSWELAYGPVPDGLCVLHRCDVPLCVRPTHLFLGTKGDNIRDSLAKGRQRGNRGIVLTPDDVRAIRAAKGSISSGVLSQRYGVSRGNITRIWGRHTWKYIT